MSDLSLQIGPKRALIRSPITNCDFMSTRPYSAVLVKPGCEVWERIRASAGLN